MKRIKLLSALLALITVIGVFGNTMIISVAADGENEPVAAEATEGEMTEGNTADGEENKGTAGGDTAEGEEEITEVDPLTRVYTSKEDMLSDMTKKVSAYGYTLYYDEKTAAVAIQNDVTKQILSTNPFDVGKSTSADSVKEQLLSQIILNYTDESDNGSISNLNSYKNAVAKGQNVVKNIKNGLRVEYSIGSVQTRRIAPRQISKDNFDNLIFANLNDEAKIRFKGFYQLMDPNREGLTEADKNEIYNKFPITETTAIYVLADDVSERELNLIESFIKLCCPDYTYEKMLEEYALLGYTATKDKAPLFKMSLEYKLTENGVDVRLAANGIRYDEDAYILNYIQILPFMGATSVENEGYIFIPDGSGAIISNTSLGSTNVSIASMMYGSDFAYQTLTAVANQQSATLPVFGAVEDVKDKTIIDENTVRMESVIDEKTGLRVSSYKLTTLTEEVRFHRDGFAAIVTEGEALSTIMFEHSGLMHNYNSVYLKVTIRPQDSYNLAEAMSVGNNVSWTVTSKRKYTGSYRISYVMLTDEDIAEENGITEYYPANYAGMALAYRDYLIKEGILKEKKSNNTDIPLYIETLGSINTNETFLTFPITVKTPLTTFEDLKTMHGDFSEEGITNINFKLTGFTNGGLYSTLPYHVKFVKSVGGNKGFKNFVEYAEENDIGVYPDFDFLYVNKVSAFDGFSFKKDAVKTIDNRYITKREYDSTLQSFVSTGLVVVSPSSYEKIYSNFKKEFVKLGGTSLSASTLGTDLNSDFDKKDPYIRELSKEYVTDILADMQESFSGVMVDGGNSYAIPYADHVLNVCLDSSGYTYAAGTVPFFGIVFHGYLDFAGSATNMAGNFDYELLKIIENGASPYFLLAYRNTTELKENPDYQEYYSVAYDIWFDDIVSSYATINEAMKSVRGETIENHEFVIAERVASEAELEEDAIREENDRLAAEKAEAAALAEIERKVNFAARMNEKSETPDPEFDAEAYRQELLEEYYNTKEELETTTKKAGKDFVVDPSTAILSPSQELIVPRPDEVIEIEIFVDGDYNETETTRYSVTDNSVAKITYSNGTVFYVNYNDFDVSVDGKVIEAFGFLKI